MTMSAKDENLLVKLLKKAVGLPGTKSGCCSAPITSGASQDSGLANCGCEAPQGATSDCCGNKVQAENPQPPGA
jgi:hypothetical protein